MRRETRCCRLLMFTANAPIARFTSNDSKVIGPRMRVAGHAEALPFWLFRTSLPR